MLGFQLGIPIYLRDTSLALRAGFCCIYKAALAHFPCGQSATFYTHRTGENMRIASRSSNSRWSPRTIKTPVEDFSQQSCQKTCPYGQSGIRRLSFCFRCTTTEHQSSSIHNSLSLELNKSGLETFVFFPPANFANSAILPTDKISTFFMQNFLPQKPKDSSLLCPQPHRGEWSSLLPSSVREPHPSYPARLT